jgi:hypothetical protein
MEPLRKTNTASLEIPHFLWKPEIHNCLYPQTDDSSSHPTTVSQMVSSIHDFQLTFPVYFWSLLCKLYAAIISFYLIQPPNISWKVQNLVLKHLQSIRFLQVHRWSSTHSNNNKCSYSFIYINIHVLNGRWDVKKSELTDANSSYKQVWFITVILKYLALPVLNNYLHTLLWFCILQ